MTPAASPMITDDSGATKPDPGVMATSPATAPEAAPSMVGFPVTTHSAHIQPRAARAAAVCVTTKAFVARAPAPNAEPALKPNQPTQSRDAPRTVKGKLWGGVGTFPNPTRLPMINTATKAEMPELI